MNEDGKKMYTVRLPERIAEWLETSAVKASTTPTNLIRSLIIRSFEVGRQPAQDPRTSASEEGQSRASERAVSDSDLAPEQRYRQLLFEIGKMRSVLLHSLDHTLGADQVDDIIEASEKTAREYVEDMFGSKGGKA
jgi:hypothetical protein